jgi:hypothetical protein
VYAFAEKFLDPDVFAGGENALIAQSAVCALAAIGDDRFPETIQRVKHLHRGWLNRQLRIRLSRLLATWREDAATERAPRSKMVESQVSGL